MGLEPDMRSLTFSFPGCSKTILRFPGNPEALVNVPGRKELTELQGWDKNENLQLLNLTYDAMPADYVAMIITELGLVSTWRFVCVPRGSWLLCERGTHSGTAQSCKDCSEDDAGLDLFTQTPERLIFGPLSARRCREKLSFLSKSLYVRASTLPFEKYGCVSNIPLLFSSQIPPTSVPVILREYRKESNALEMI